MVGIISDIGNYRKLHEDAVGYFENLRIRFYVIADGMGGHNAGEVASNLAIKGLIDYFKRKELTDDFKDELLRGIKKVNEDIYKVSIEKETYKGMGTTVTACVIHKNKMYIGHVGDSSCIIVYKNNKIDKVTKDHSLVQELVDSGSITKEEASNHPNKNIITRALGVSDHVEVDIYEFQLEEIDKVLLCTDGLTNGVSLDDILNYVISNSEEVACEKLVNLSKKNGSKDNISAIVFKGADENDR